MNKTKIQCGKCGDVKCIDCDNMKRIVYNKNTGKKCIISETIKECTDGNNKFIS